MVGWGGVVLFNKVDCRERFFVEKGEGALTTRLGVFYVIPMCVLFMGGETVLRWRYPSMVGFGSIFHHCGV